VLTRYGPFSTHPINSRLIPPQKTDPREIALVKKLDRWIMPMLWSMYWLNYLDRNAIALARLDDLEKDLKLTSTQYQTCVSILFVGYLLGQIPR
jgi:hypothetical protein